jgi:hypothetical protein
LRDTFAIATPLPILGSIAELLFLRRYMVALKRKRNAVIKQVAEASLMIGSAICKQSGKRRRWHRD